MSWNLIEVELEILYAKKKKKKKKKNHIHNVKSSTCSLFSFSHYLYPVLGSSFNHSKCSVSPVIFSFKKMKLFYDVPLLQKCTIKLRFCKKQKQNKTNKKKNKNKQKGTNINLCPMILLTLLPWQSSCYVHIL